jgi:hypothetical protein
MLIRRGTSEASVAVRMEGFTSKGDGGWAKEGDGGHFGERGQKGMDLVLIRHCG